MIGTQEPSVPLPDLTLIAIFTIEGCQILRVTWDMGFGVGIWRWVRDGQSPGCQRALLPSLFVFSSEGRMGLLLLSVDADHSADTGRCKWLMLDLIPTGFRL